MTKERPLQGQIETIGLMDFRNRTGEIMLSTRMGKVFLIVDKHFKDATPFAVLSAIPGTELSVTIKSNGEKEYKL